MMATRHDGQDLVYDAKHGFAHSSHSECPHSLKATASRKISWQMAHLQLSGGADVNMSDGNPMVNGYSER